MAKRVIFRLEKVYNADLGVYECVIHRQNMSTVRSGMDKKDIVLVATVANTMACIFDDLDLKERETLEFELTCKINRK